MLRSAFPDVRIGFLVGSWSAPVLQDHPDVDRLHFFDHYFLNRREASRLARVRSHLRTRRQAIGEIRSAPYDVAIELFPRVHNAVTLLWRAQVPVRIGYTSGGFGPLLTHRLEWTASNRHVSQYHIDLLRLLPLGEYDVSQARVVIPSVESGRFLDESASAGLERRGYVVFHVGAGDAFRQWQQEKWRELARCLARDGYRIAFTGSGEAEEAAAAKVISGLESCVNLCGRLSWAGFVAAIEHAAALVCVDTVAQHVASGFDTPCVVITAGRHPQLWRPMHERHKVAINPVPCIPCYRRGGCEGMECITRVSAGEVYEAVTDLIGTGGPPRSSAQ